MVTQASVCVRRAFCFQIPISLFFVREGSELARGRTHELAWSRAQAVAHGVGVCTDTDDERIGIAAA